MKQNIRSGMPVKIGSLVLKKLIELLSLGGPLSVENYAMVLQMLKDTNQLATPEGVKLVKLCASKIKGTIWESHIFPKPIAIEQKETEKIFDEHFDKLKKEKPHLVKLITDL